MFAMSDDQDDITRTHVPLGEDTLIGHYRITEEIGASRLDHCDYFAEPVASTNLSVCPSFSSSTGHLRGPFQPVRFEGALRHYVERNVLRVQIRMYFTQFACSQTGR